MADIGRINLLVLVSIWTALMASGLALVLSAGGGLALKLVLVGGVILGAAGTGAIAALELRGRPDREGR